MADDTTPEPRAGDAPDDRSPAPGYGYGYQRPVFADHAERPPTDDRLDGAAGTGGSAPIGQTGSPPPQTASHTGKSVSPTGKPGSPAPADRWTTRAAPPPRPAPPPTPPTSPVSSPAAPIGWAPEPARAPRRRLPVRPSPVFAGLVAVMAVAGGWLFVRSPGGNVLQARVAIFIFVVTGWIVSLCLHEFSHAATAWAGGDHSVEGRGYLTLDPRRYMNRQLSIVLPILVVLIGGIGLPGGAVMIDPGLIPSRARRSMVSASGPLTNLVCALLCALPLAAHLVAAGRHEALADALAFLAFLEVAATVLNALPVPGLDGFGVIAPYLSEETVASLMPIANYVFFGLFIVLFYSAAASGAFFRACDHVLSVVGVHDQLVSDGHLLFMFWRKLQ